MAFNLDLGKISDFYTREVFKQVINSLVEFDKNTGKIGATGATGPAGESFANIDGGTPFSTYGGIASIDGGGVS